MQNPNNTAAEPASARTIHIDTSLQIEQQKGVAKSAPVRTLLNQYVFTSTSSYARKEFKRAWLQDLNLIYKKSKGATQIGDVYSAIEASLWNPRAKRRLRRCLDAINAFLERNASLPLDVAAIRLRAHVGEMILGAYIKWERSVTHEYNGTKCIRAAERPVRAADGTIDVTVRECRSTKVQCEVHDFFKKHQTEFSRIESAVFRQDGTAVSQELQTTAVLIQRATKDPILLCDSKNCSAMSDAIIAVDGIAADHYGANNPREWETIAAALGKPLKNPVASPRAGA